MKNNSEIEFEWNDLKETWINSSQTCDIHIQMGELLKEINSKTSQFEKDSIKGDLAILKTNWTEFKGMVSQFEKEAVKKDLVIVMRLLKKLLNLFKR